MEIIRRQLLDDYKRKHANCIKPLNNWEKLIRLAKWKTPQEIRNAIGTADFLSERRVIFNIGGNNYRLVTVVEFTAQHVVILWIGTHAEYSKKRF